MVNRLKNHPPGVQFVVFFALAAGMFFVSMLITQAFFGDLGVLLKDEEVSPAMLNKFKWAQFASAIVSFLVPSLIFARWASDVPSRYIGIRPGPKVLVLIATFVLLLAVSPLIMVVGEWNQNANFGALQDVLKKFEDLNERILTRFMKMDSPIDLLFNLVVVAILPAIAEELFFRGCLQNILERWTKVPAVAIGLSSLGFAFMHGTFFKFLPILMLGIVLGTLFYVTRNLWYCILFHFINNSLALLASYYATRNETMKKLAENDVQVSVWAGLISLVVVIGIFYFIRRRIPYQTVDYDIPNTDEIYRSSPR